MAVFSRLVYHACSAIVIALLVTACGAPAVQQVKPPASGGQTANKYAKRFAISAAEDYTLVSVFGNRFNFDTTANYILTNRKQPVETNFCFQKNVSLSDEKKIASLSSIYSAMLSAVGAANQVIAIDNIDYVNDSVILHRYNKKQLAEVAKGPTPDLEKLIALKPDLVFMFGMGDPGNEVPAGISGSGITAVVVTDHLEEHPLARAEWIRFFAAFCGKLSMADSIFNTIEQNYLQLKQQAATSTKKPTVFTEMKYGEAWYMPGGKSYIAVLIADAGGQYLWADNTQSGSLPLSFEQVLARAGNADVWLNPPMMFSLNAIRASDERYEAFKAFKSARVYNNTKVRNAKGYSNYWELGIMRPDWVLQDLINIFAGDTNPNVYHFYEQLK